MHNINSKNLLAFWPLSHSFLFFCLATSFYVLGETGYSFVVLSGAGSALSVVIIVNIFRHARMIKFTTLTAGAMGFGYIFSSFVALISANSATPEISFGYGYGTLTAISLAEAMALVHLSISILIIASLLERPIKIDDAISCLSLASGKRVTWVLLFFCILGFATGVVGYTGVATDDGSPSAIGSILAIIVPILPAMFTAILSLRKYRTVRDWTLYLMAIAASLCLVAIFGRRVLLVSMFLVILTLFASGYKPKFNLRLAILVLSSAAILYAGFLFLVGIRISFYMLPADSTLGEAVATSIHLFASGQTAQIADYIEATTGSRTFIISYLAIMVEAGPAHTPLFGADVVASLENSIPSALLPSKGEGPIAEELTHPSLGIPVFDGPNSVITSGYVDFRSVGALIYPVAKAAVISSFIRVVLRISRNRPANLLVTFAAILSVIYIESSLVYLFTGMRNSILLLIAMIPAMALARIRILRQRPRVRIHRLS